MAAQRQFYIVPTPGVLGHSFASVLRYFGYLEAPTWRNADLIILEHHDRNHYLAPAELSFYRFQQTGRPKKVVVLAPGGRLRHGSATPHWLHFISEPSNDFRWRNLLPWLNEPTQQRGQVTSIKEHHSPQFWRRLLAHLLFFDPTKHARAFKPRLTRTRVSKLLPSTLGKDASELEWFWSADAPLCYYAFLRLARSRESHKHDLMKTLAHALLQSQKELSHTIQIEAFLEACDDLRSSLNTPLRANRQRKIILVIDDNPQEFEQTLEILSPLLAGAEIWKWCPNMRDETLSNLCDYESLHFHQLTTRELKIEQVGVRRTRHLAVSEILQSTEFLLVDQLLPSPEGQQSIRGPKLIRGLKRLTLDLHEADSSLGSPAQIVALSRTPDPSVVERALTFGARDYLLKSNLGRLPAILAGLSSGGEETAPRLQTTFRRLTDIKPSTAALLSSISIPGSKFDLTNERHRKLYSLVGTLPKTDLHVHVGSCMAPEFLLAASAIGLAQYLSTVVPKLPRISALLQCCLSGSQDVSIDVRYGQDSSSLSVLFEPGKDWMANCASASRTALHRELDSSQGSAYSALRSFLHSTLGVSDYLPLGQVLSKLTTMSDLRLVHLCIRYSSHVHGSEDIHWDNFARLYLLFLAAQDGQSYVKWRDSDLLHIFRQGTQDIATMQHVQEAWAELRDTFYPHTESFRPRGIPATSSQQFSPEQYRPQDWHQARDIRPPLRISYSGKVIPPFERPAITSIIATGPESRSLKEYLVGCAFTGSTHLKHPFLFHLYAQHVVHEFVSKGVVYAELRGSPDGYENPRIGFSFHDACQCLVQAFEHAQTYLTSLWKGEKPDSTWLPEQLFDGSRWTSRTIAARFHHPSRFERRLPVKVGLILVGKRHKSTRQMILEGAASALLYRGGGTTELILAKDALKGMESCRIVGFDLAGDESSFPPELFAEEFRRIARLHIPITVHAGENASSQFVEDAILELRARRIGHGLSLTDDDRLMARVREDRICVELCPVSNHQTCHFTPEGTPGRTYPLKRLLEFGIPVCINTDNPQISDTDIVQEYFMASRAMQPASLSLWDVLRLIRAGFRHAFLSLPERRALLELVDQFTLDFFTDSEVEAELEHLAELEKNLNSSGAN